MPVIVNLEAFPLEVPLREPFVIASGRMDATRGALVRVVVEGPGGWAEGFGEAASLPPVTHEDMPDVLQAVALAVPMLVGASIDDHDTLAHRLLGALPDTPVARSGIEAAILDAWARLENKPLFRLLGELAGDGAPLHAPPLVTDITVPILAHGRMVELAAQYQAAGFQSLKIKVGRDVGLDAEVLQLLAQAAPNVSFRIDANGGYDADAACALLEATRALRVACFEQPCARDDLAGSAEVTRFARSLGVPVVADESVTSLADLDAIVEAQAADGVNLKLAKSGGLLAAREIGRVAQECGLCVMAGAMVETRLGLAAMAHVVCSLGGVDFVDLDTALLLAEDPFAGGYTAEGSRMDLEAGPGHGVRPRT